MALAALVAFLPVSLLAFFTIEKILGLERASESQLGEVSRARLELRRFSHRLVAVQEQERRRVARELRDEVVQAISAVLSNSAAWKKGLPADQLESRARASVTRELADRAVAQVRDMALLLRPSMLDDLGLEPAWKWEAREVSRRTGVEVKVVAETVADDLPDDCRTYIYRTVQQAVNNSPITPTLPQSERRRASRTARFTSPRS